LRPGRSLLLFPLAVALCWGIVIAVFASIGRLWGPEDEQGTWGKVVGAALGNFVFVFLAAIAVSGIMRIVQNRSS
jgi:predicted permease